MTKSYNSRNGGRSDTFCSTLYHRWMPRKWHDVFHVEYHALRFLGNISLIFFLWYFYHIRFVFRIKNSYQLSFRSLNKSKQKKKKNQNNIFRELKSTNQKIVRTEKGNNLYQNIFFCKIKRRPAKNNELFLGEHLNTN